MFLYNTVLQCQFCRICCSNRRETNRWFVITLDDKLLNHGHKAWWAVRYSYCIISCWISQPGTQRASHDLTDPAVHKAWDRWPHFMLWAIGSIVIERTWSIEDVVGQLLVLKVLHMNLRNGHYGAFLVFRLSSFCTLWTLPTQSAANGK